MPNRLRCFVVMPYSQESDVIYSTAIVPALRDLKEYDVLVLRADVMPRDITIKAHVEKVVQSADFCIVDVTGHNPNVMYELGYATGVNRPIIVTKEKNSEILAADISDVGILQYDKGDLISLKQRLTKACLRTIKQIIARRSANKELAKSPAASVFHWAEPILIESFLGSIRESFSSVVGSPAGLIQTLLPRLYEMLNQNLMVRLVIANPEGEFIFARARELELNVAQYRARLWNDIEELLRVFKTTSGQQYSLRLTDKPVYNSIFLSDELGIMVPYFASRSSRQSVAIQFSRTDNLDMYSFLQQQFVQIWSTSDTSPIVTPRYLVNEMEE